MATTSSYYINAPSLASATAVFIDADLTICAPNGFYSDGSISREQVACVLLPQQTCPSCVSYNCISGVCTDPGNGTGEFATLVDCQAFCGVIEYDIYLADKYECGTCALFTASVLVALPMGTIPNYGKYYIPTSGSGELGIYVYQLISATTGGPGLILTTINHTTCADACGTPPPISFNCISGTCIDPDDGTGTYPTLGDCIESCGVAVTYNCVEGICTDPGDGTGTYSTLSACEAACSGITYVKYIAQVRDCNDCNAIINTIVVAFDDSLPLPTLSRYYLPETGPDGFAYHVIATSTSTDPGFILTTVFGSFNNCNLCCSA